jgi:hypothetical protein
MLGERSRQTQRPHRSHVGRIDADRTAVDRAAARLKLRLQPVHSRLPLILALGACSANAAERMVAWLPNCRTLKGSLCLNGTIQFHRDSELSGSPDNSDSYLTHAAADDYVELEQYFQITESEHRLCERSGLRLILLLDCHELDIASSTAAEKTKRELLRSRNDSGALWVVRDPIKDYATEIRSRNLLPASRSAEAFARRWQRLLESARIERIVRLEDLQVDMLHAICNMSTSLDLPLGPYFDSLSEHLAPGACLESGDSPIEDIATMGGDAALEVAVAASPAMTELRRRLGYTVEKPPSVEHVAPSEPMPLQTETRTEAGDVEAITADTHKILGTLTETVSTIRKDLSGMTRHLDWLVKSEAQNVSRQVEAFLSLGQALRGEIGLPAMHGWPISPDFALLLVSMIQEAEYQAVIEFGSGTSTVVVARALAQRRISNPTTSRPVQMAFEHIEDFSHRTVKSLRECGLDTAVSLHVAPLVRSTFHSGQSHMFYDCQDAIGGLRVVSDAADPRVLVIVDGPPGVTGPHARLPALATVMQALPHCRIDLLLDDYGRQEEKEIGAIWKAHLDSIGATFAAEEFDLEKGALLLTIDPVAVGAD